MRTRERNSERNESRSTSDGACPVNSTQYSHRRTIGNCINLAFVRYDEDSARKLKKKNMAKNMLLDLGRNLPCTRHTYPHEKRQGDDVCALELEISREARMAAAEAAGESTGHTNTDGPGGGENFDVPLVLVTLGWDPSGDPTHAEPALGRDSSCVRRVLQLPRVLKWFTSHTRYDSEVNEKVCVLCV